MGEFLLIGEVDAIATGSGGDDPVSDAEVKEAAYVAEIAEIARLREALRSKHDSLAGARLTTQARARGYEILDRRLATTEAMYVGEPLPEFEKLEPLERESRPPDKPKAKPKPKLGPRWPAKAAGLMYYTPDKPCKRGHFKRFTSTGACPACNSLRDVVKNAQRRAR